MSVPPDSADSAAPRLDDAALIAALSASQRLGMLGTAPISQIIEHSGAFLAPLFDISGMVVDLGSGGGVPGVVIAWMRPDLNVVLVDRRATRTDHLQRLVHRLERQDQVTVLATEAVALPRLLDGPADAVVARSFGPPKLVLKAAVPILADNGIIVVSEPPSGSKQRWSSEYFGRVDLQRLDWPDPRVAVIGRADRQTPVFHEEPCARKEFGKAVD